MVARSVSIATVMKKTLRILSLYFRSKSMKKKKKAVFVGIADKIQIKSKSYVMGMLYKRAKKNPFMADKTYEEYLEYIKSQVRLLEGIEIKADTEEEMYNALKSLGWLKEISVLAVYIVTANYGIA
jgi:hypothetical protein